MDFFETLSIRYASLTRQGRKIGDYLRQNGDAALGMTAKTLGEASGTSAAAVVRFCKQLGYTSLEMMKIKLGQSLHTQGDDLSLPVDTIITGTDSFPEISEKLYTILHSALLQTQQMLSQEDLKRAVTLIQKAQRVFIFGIGGSGLTALDFSHKLNRIGKPCIYLEDGHTNLEYAAVATPKDVMLCISYSGETREVNLAAGQGRANGVPIIAITRNKQNTLSELATINLWMPKVEKRIRVGAFGSKFAQMFIADVLYLGIIHKDFDNYEKALIDSARLANQLRE